MFKYSCGVIESLAVHVEELDLTIVVVYRPPDNPPRPTDDPAKFKARSTNKQFKKFTNKLNEFLRELPTPSPDILLMGDFNLPNANWISGECKTGASSDERAMVKNLYEIATEHFLVQQIEGPTHRAGNLLDLVFTNNAQLVHSYTATPTVQSDHSFMQINANYAISGRADEEDDSDDEDIDSAGADSNETILRNLNFHSSEIDWSAISSAINSVDWNGELDQLDVEGMLDKFLTTITGIASTLVPSRKPRSSNNTQQPIPNHRRVLMRKRSKLEKAYAAATNPDRKTALERKLISIEKDLQSSYETQERKEEMQAIGRIKTNSKFFYSYANKKSKLKVAVGPLMSAAKTLVTSTKKMAEMLSQQYQSVFSRPKHDAVSPNTLFPDEADADSTLQNFQFTRKELEEAMGELSPTSAAGPDGMPAILLKNCKKELSLPLAILWRKSLEDGTVPALCKTANIVPIHKGKSRAVPANYRPVALTSQLIKIFEKVVRRKIVAHLEKLDLFNPSQHGFRSGRSCLSQLLIHFDRVTSLLEQGKSVDVIYLDFAKAFDKVDIGVSLQKLHTLGIRGKLGRWLFAFLNNRRQAVVLDGKKSQQQQVISGVPQGSVLGPLIFLVLIGDIDKEVVHAFLSSFADDTRVGCGIESDEDVKLLQQDLEAVYRWATTNNMMFNSDKFELVRYRSKKAANNSTLNYTSNDDKVIEEKEVLTDLGITMSNDATFDQHILSMREKIMKKTGWALRTFRTRERLPMMTIWKSLVMPYHDYCSQLWSPIKTGMIQSIELLQRSFISKIRGLNQLSYWEQLKSLKLYSLERRRERYIIIYVWQILEGLAPNIETTSIQTSSNIGDRRGRLCRVPAVSRRAPRSVQAIRAAFLGVRGAFLFNALPLKLRNMTDCHKDKFKMALDKYLSTVPDEPLIPGYTAQRRCESNSLLDWAPALQRQQDLVIPEVERGAEAVQQHGLL